MKTKQKILIYSACILLFCAVGNALAQGQAWERREYDLARTHYYPYGSTGEVSLGDFTPLWSAPVSAQLALTGDINGDSKLEVIAWDRPNLRVYDSEGQSLWNVTISESPSYEPVLLDVTGDGILEIAVGRRTSSNSLQMLVYDGSGSLLKTISRAGGSNASIGPWMAGDLNNDGKIEILAALDAGYCRYPRGVSLFDFETGVELWHYAIGPQSGGLSVGDIDEDNDLEFVRGGGTPHNGTVGCGVNNQATCTSDGNVATIVAEAGSGSEVFTRTYGAADGWLFHAIVDLDHDGDSHILCFRGYDNYYPGIMSVFLLDDQGNTINTWTYPGSQTNRRVQGTSRAIADIDNDNLDEIILCDQAPHSDYVLRILEDNLTQQIPPVAGLVDAYDNRVFIVVADITGDGSNDILVTDMKNGKLRVLDSALTQVWSYDLANIQHVALSDLNDDGIPEIILSGNSLIVLANTCTGPPDFPICDAFLTSRKVNVGHGPWAKPDTGYNSNWRHDFKIHIIPCDPMDVSVGDSADVFVDVDTSGTFDEDENYLAIVSSTDADGEALDIAIKVYIGEELIDNDPCVAIYSINNIPIVDTLGNQIDYLCLDTFDPHGGDKSHISGTPKSVSLKQNYPNPFNPETEISYSLPEATQVRLTVYNVLGRRVRTLVDEYQIEGQRRVHWDGKDDSGSNVASGIYFYRLDAAEYTETKKMVLMR